MSRSIAIGLLLAAVAALALRCPALKQRPMHNDEAVNAIKFRFLWEQGFHQFDPNEHHGPTLHYLTLAWAKLNRVSTFAELDEARLRGLTVCFGVGLILLLLLVADGVGRSATVCSAALTAISPAMVFYSRYYIHEMLLVFFTFLAFAAGWRYFRSLKLVWAVLAGVAVGLMQATKETFILALAAIAVALVLNKLWVRESTKAPTPLNLKHVAVAVGAWVVVAVVLFSSFFSNARGPLDAVWTYLPWLNRAGGDSPHVHPWHFYLERLAYFHVKGGPIWSEGLILGLALIGFIVAFTGRGASDSHKGFLRVLALYTLTLAAIYSLIAYKTPWCLLGFWDGAILLAGVGAVALWRRARQAWMKAVVALLLLAGVVDLANQAWQASVTYAADRQNPYVYAQTSPNILALVNRVEALARVHPRGHQMTIKIMAPGSDYWPLPWYLRAFDQTGWWAEVPDDPYAPVMIVSAKLHAGLDESKSHVMTGLFELRPDAFLELYVETDLWRAYLNSRPEMDDAE
jgi:uncharacterized protein (TIGR03663 family)